MFHSLRLGKILGIDLYIHGTFWLLPLFILISGILSGGTVSVVGWDLALIFGVFGCIALHELGHSLAARAYGIGTRDITLYPIGGVASLERMPEKPRREIAIALAGPAVNIVIALALLAMMMGQFVLFPIDVAAPGEIAEFLGRLMVGNLILAGFNLLPAFPMDGGRVLRALLAVWMPRVRATGVAVAVGSFVAAGFLIVGLTLPQFGLVVLAVVVYLLGQAELAAVRVQSAAREWSQRVGQWLGPPHGGTVELVWDETRGEWVPYDRDRPIGPFN